MMVWLRKRNDHVEASLCELRKRTETWNHKDPDGNCYFMVTLQDRDHQSMIETLGAIWPDWQDGDLFVERILQ